MADASVYVPRTFSDGGAKIADGHKTVDAATAQRWLAEGNAVAMGEAPESADAASPVVAPIVDPADSVPFVAGAFRKGEVPSWVKDFKAAARANIAAANAAGETTGATVTITAGDATEDKPADKEGK